MAKAEPQPVVDIFDDGKTSIPPVVVPSKNAKSDAMVVKKKMPVGVPFKKGNPGGPGYPLAGEIYKRKMALHSCVTEEAIIKMTKAMIKEACAGSVAAYTVLMDRAIGKVENTEPTTTINVDIGSIIVDESAKRKEELLKVLNV